MWSIDTQTADLTALRSVLLCFAHNFDSRVDTDNIEHQGNGFADHEHNKARVDSVDIPAQLAFFAKLSSALTA